MQGITQKQAKMLANFALLIPHIPEKAENYLLGYMQGLADANGEPKEVKSIRKEIGDAKAKRE